MDRPSGLILTKDNMQEIEYILNSILEQQLTKDNHTCYISFSTKSYISKFKCDKIRIFMFNHLYRITFREECYGNNNTDYECFNIDEKHGGIFKFDISFSEGYYAATKATNFQINLGQFFI
ncbi:hypothetical protein [Clostridium tagluense]|uniref:hypothetical protein n=1 Tax=Clostridium tagluense TaxID=360422 RepID=UPI001CF2DDFE|nr:hypothetical protein [Clostridium tagluense]MCB2300427.1 hypothetical protein [Clostridium tagluense]